MIKNKLIESKVKGIDNSFDVEKLKKMLNEKFKNINYKEAKEDIYPFIEDKKSLDEWSGEFFVEITKELK